MSLSSDLISQFVKITKDEKPANTETTVYGKTVEYNGKMYVKLDGSELLTPVSTTADVKSDERVTVMIKNHTATVTGNLSSPAARTDDVKELTGAVNEVEILMAYKVTTEDLEAINATIKQLRAIAIRVDKLEAVEAEIETLEARFAELEYVSAEEVEALYADIETLEATFGEFTDISTEDMQAINAEIGNLRGYTADFTYVSADMLAAFKANIEKLDVEKLSANQADLRYANIDFSNIGEAAMMTFYAESGLIRDVVVDNGNITGHLVGVTISGDLIEGNTIKADKLVIKNDKDGLYYKLNIEGGAIASAEVTEQDLQNGLSGSVIIANSITAEKISVSDLVAFDATIGGFNISKDSIYSGAKSSAVNSTRGIYLDKEGQLSVGDETNFIKYYKDDEGRFKLEISADSVLIGANRRTVEDLVEESIGDKLDDALGDLSVGGRNLIRKSNAEKWHGEWINLSSSTSELLDDGWVHVVNTNNEASYGIYTPKISNVPAGEYTLSFEAYSDDASQLDHLNFMNDDANLPLGLTIAIGTDATRYTASVVLTEDQENFGLMVGTTNGTNFHVRNIKMEKGNVATDYTEAPEDADQTVSDLADELHKTIVEQSSRIEANTEGIFLSHLEGYLKTGDVPTEYEDFSAFVSYVTTQLNVLKNSVEISIPGRLNDLNEANQAINDKFNNEIYANFIFDFNGLTIGREGSPYKITLSENEYTMSANGKAVIAFDAITKQAHIPKLTVNEEFKLFGYVISQDGDLINCEYVGG